MTALLAPILRLLLPGWEEARVLKTAPVGTEVRVRKVARGIRWGERKIEADVVLRVSGQ